MAKLHSVKGAYNAPSSKKHESKLLKCVVSTGMVFFFVMFIMSGGNKKSSATQDYLRSGQAQHRSLSTSSSTEINRLGTTTTTNAYDTTATSPYGTTTTITDTTDAAAAAAAAKDELALERTMDGARKELEDAEQQDVEKDTEDVLQYAKDTGTVVSTAEYMNRLDDIRAHLREITLQIEKELLALDGVHNQILTI